MAGNLGYLHTSTKYGSFNTNLLSGITNDSELVIKGRFEAAIANLENKERFFYSQFGFNSAESFFRAIHNLLIRSQKDLKILQGFNATNLNSILEQFKNPLDNLSNIYIVFNTEKATADLTSIVQQMGGRNVTVTTNKPIAFSAQWNISQMKKLVNAAYGRHFQSENEKATSALISFLQNEAADLIQIYPDKEHVNHNDRIDFRSGPFNYGAKEMREMDPEKVKIIQRQIGDFIFNKLGLSSGSPALQSAARTVWRQTIEKSGAAFFVGGAKGWKKLVVGNLGEFQTAVFFQYLANASSSPQLAAQISEVIGSDYNSASEKLRTDVTLLEAFGVQVKNYNSDVYTQYLKGGGSKIKNRKIDVNLHPMQIPSIVSDTELLNYVINSYFNTDFDPPSADEWATFFKNHADEVLNLAGYDNTYDDIPDFGDKATFYMIRGYFIPGSVIMRGAMEQKLNVSSTSVSASEQHDSAYYAGEAGNKSNAPLLKWWRYKEGVIPADWEATDDNNLSAWNGKISIKTTFEYQSIITALTGGMYKIF